jgi:hypothetical protein
MSPEKAERIVQVLRNTDLTITEIAERFGCSKSVIVKTNRKYKVRAYVGLRSRWIVAPTPVAKLAA